MSVALVIDVTAWDCNFEGVLELRLRDHQWIMTITIHSGVLMI